LLLIGGGRRYSWWRDPTFRGARHTPLCTIAGVAYHATQHLVAAVPALLDCVGRYEIDELVRTTAAGYASPELGSLDAIHLATAQAVFGEALTCFVTYDRRLRCAAEALLLPVASPGIAAV
jgi:predicted nucleic acid-binding protein